MLYRIGELHIAAGKGKNGDGRSEAKAAKQVHPQCLEAVVDGLIGACVADEQEGDDAGNLPDKVHPDQVLRQNQSIHGS